MKYLVLEYSDSAMAAFYNRNNYDENLVNKFMIANNPRETEITNHTSKKEIEQELTELRAEFAREILQRDRIISKLRTEIRGTETIHYGPLLGPCNTTVYDMVTTTDKKFVNCKRCITRFRAKERQEAINEAN